MRRCFIKTNYEKYLKSDYGLKEGMELNVSYEDFFLVELFLAKEEEGILLAFSNLMAIKSR